MRNKLQSTAGAQSSGRRPRTSSKRDRSTERKDNSVGRSDDESSEDEDSDPNSHPLSNLQKSKSLAPTSNIPAAMPSSLIPGIEAAIQAVVDETLLLAIKDAVKANPLSEKIPVTVLQETLHEIRSEIKSQVTLTVSVSSSRFRWVQRIKEYCEGSYESKGSERYDDGLITVPPDVREEIQSIVHKSLSIPAGEFLHILP